MWSISIHKRQVCLKLFILVAPVLFFCWGFRVLDPTPIPLTPAEKEANHERYVLNQEEERGWESYECSKLRNKGIGEFSVNDLNKVEICKAEGLW